MRDKQVLALLWIDVHAARDDHECRPVCEVEIPLLVDIADVVDGAHRAIRRQSRRRSYLIIEVLKWRGRLEPQFARSTNGTRLHLLIEYMQFAQYDLAHCASVCEPFGSVASRQSKTLGCAVILIDDRSPPLNHLLLDLNWTWRCRMNGHLKGREIVFGSNTIRQLEQPGEHRRHKLTVRHLEFLDEGKIAFGFEALHDDGCAAVPDRKIDRDMGRRVIERSWR